jgi:hypothetical protein
MSSAFGRRLLAWRDYAAGAFELDANLLGQTRGVGARVEFLRIFRGLVLSRRVLALGHGVPP